MEVKSIGGLDIISTIPQDITAQILSRLSNRDALRTSILSKKWRYRWMRVSIISFEDKMFDGLYYSKEIMKCKLANAIFHVLLLHTSPLVKFSLSLDVEMVSELDQIIIYLSRSYTLQELNLANNSAKHYKLPRSFYSLQGLWYLRVTNCHFVSPLTSTFNGFSKLTWLSFTNVEISSQMLKRFLTNSPLLQTLYLLGDLPKVTSEKDLTFVELYECLPSIKTLGFSHYYLQYFAAGGMPQKLPNSSLQVKSLIFSLYFMDRDTLSGALYLIKSSPNLKTLSIWVIKYFNDIVIALFYYDLLSDMIYYNGKSNIRPTSMEFLDLGDYSDLKLDHLQKLWMHTFKNLPIEIEFVKLVMARASLLKTALIVLHKYVSVNEELEMFRDLIRLPFPRASPSTQLFVRRPKTSSYF